MKNTKNKADPEVENKKQQECWRLAKEAYGRKDWDAAEMYYTKAIRATPKNAKMYVFRGGVRSVRAQSIKDRNYYLETLAAVVEDYRKAYELAPDDPEVGASLVEAEICRGRATETATQAIELWNRTDDSVWKGICSWLGSVACALDGRPDGTFSKAKKAQIEALLACLA